MFEFLKLSLLNEKDHDAKVVNSYSARKGNNINSIGNNNNNIIDISRSSNKFCNKWRNSRQSTDLQQRNI